MTDNKGDNNKAKENGYTQNGGYRKFYSQAKQELVKRHKKEHREIMIELGYKPKAKKVKKEASKVEPKS